MIYIFEQGNVVYDGSTIDEEVKAKAVVVAERPKIEQQEGKIAILKWDVSTQTAWYEYEDIPPTPEDETQKKITELEQAIAELTILISTPTI